MTVSSSNMFKRRRKFLRKPNQTEFIGLMVALALVAFAGDRAFRQHQAASALQGAPLVLTPTTTANGSTTTVPSLDDRSYKAGDCITWDQTIKTSRSIPTAVVPCSGPHLFEYAASIEMKDAPIQYPSDDEWTSITNAQCGPLVQAFMGKTIDPDGIFDNGILHPTAEGWAENDRTLKCGVQFSDRAANADPSLLLAATGEARGADQNPPIAKGTCWVDSSDATRSGTIDCGQPHQLVITGSISLADLPARPKTDAAWRSAADAKCTAVSRAYLDHPLKSNEQSNLFQISDASWNAGNRTVNCFVGRPDGNGWATIGTLA